MLCLNDEQRSKQARETDECEKREQLGIKTLQNKKINLKTKQTATVKFVLLQMYVCVGSEPGSAQFSSVWLCVASRFKFHRQQVKINETLVAAANCIRFQERP